ncbi:MAG: dynamin family protein [Lachnospiraceae bacterium]
MERIIKSLNELHKINTAYSLSNETIEKLTDEADGAKVCTPIIGKFSSGKSALLNTVLGYSRNRKILREDITPETAVPAEITYSSDEDRVYVVRNDGSYKSITVSDYRQLEVDANTVRCTRLNLKNGFLEEIPDVMLVDMPGFESGFEVHNRAIDNYLPQSLAYIIAFPADDMIVRSSVGNILKELCLHDMPICIAITKYDKRGDDFENTFAALKESLKRFIGDREVTYCITSSFSGDAEELEEFLRNIQERSQEILANKFRNAVLSAADATENYLRTSLKSSEMSESELDEQEERLGKQLDSLNGQFSREKDSFDLQISDCVEEIKADVQIALEAEESSFVAMVMNNQSINDRMNTVVRNAVTVSVKKRFIPKVEKYLKRVANCINGESVGDVHVSFNFNTEDVSKGMVSTTVAAVAAIIVAGPIIGGLIAGLIAFVNKIKGDKKREELKNKIRMQLNSDVYPLVLKEVGNGIEIAITKQLKLINTSIEEEIANQRAALEKAIEDVRKQMSDEKERKENLAIDIKSDLEKIELIRQEIG